MIGSTNAFPAFEEPAQKRARYLGVPPEDLANSSPCWWHAHAVWKGLHVARRRKCAASGRDQPGVCAQTVRVCRKRNRQVFQITGWDALTGRGRCARWKISDHQRRSTDGDVLVNPDSAGRPAKGSIRSRLYPALFRLVRQGLLKASWGTSENNRRAKFYELTAAGRKRLREETEGWNRLATAIGSALAAQPEEI